MTRFGVWLAAGWSAVVVAFPVSAAETAVHLRGSNALVPAARKIAEAYMASHPGVAIVVRGGDSGPGLKALLDGTTDIAMISAEIPPEVAKRAKALNVTLQAEPVALDAIVPVTHPGNPVSSLSMDQLGALYTGLITNWARVGGDDMAVAVLAMPAASGTASGWKQAVTGERVQTPRAETLVAPALKAKVAATSAAIGYLGLGSVDQTVKAIAVDGIAAAPDAIQSGRYPIRRQLALVTTDTTGPAARHVVTWFLSPEAQAMVAETGLLPVR